MERDAFASLLADRKIAAGLCGAAAVHLGLRAAGWSGWPCPLLSTFGVPCPGCGLSRAAVALLRGEFGRAMTLHAFAPVAIAGMALLVAASALGPQPRTRLIGWVRRIEQRSGFSVWMLAALLLYWALRLTLDVAGFASLVR